MRKLIVTSLLALTVLSAACKEPDPNRFETHIERIQNAETRSQGFTGLEKLTKTVLAAQDNQDLVDEFATKAIPAFEAVWDDAEEQQEKMLGLLAEVGRPEGAPVWNRALKLDGSSEARKKVIVALDGIKKSKATGSTEAIIELLEEVIKDPKLDAAEREDGLLRMMMATTLGIIGDKKAVPVLIKAMEQEKEKQPVAVHRAAAQALGRIGDPAAVDALLTVTFRVPDAPTSTNIGVRAKLALAAIGEPAVPKVLAMLRGDHEGVQALAAENAVPQPVIQQTAASILGAMGSASAVDDLIGFMPTADCVPPDPKAKKKKGDDEPDAAAAGAAGLRAVIANALGFIGDPKAAKAMCGCVLSTDNPGDMFPVMEALGRVGGSEAATCLSEVIKTGKYDTEIVRKEFAMEPRWDAARFAILAAGAADLAGVKAAMASNKDATVTTELAKWDAALKMAEECKEDADCYLKTLDNVNADWFAREKAAFEVARLKKGDVASAEAISRAFKVRNPDARINMAWLPVHMLEPGTDCPKCVDAINAVLDAEKMSMDAKFQASVLRARATMAALRPAGMAEADVAAAE